MRLRYFPRTRLWPAPSKRRERRSAAGGKAGSIALIVVFVFFLFAVLGLGTIDLTQTYLKLSAYKKNALLLSYSAENGVKRSLARLYGFMERAANPLPLAADRLEAIKADARAGGIETAEDAMGLTFPDRIEETSGDQAWTGTTRCTMDRFTDAVSYFLADYHIAVEAEGRLKNFSPGGSAALDLALKTVAGRIPLSFFPFLLTGTAGNGTVTELVAAKKLQLLPSRLKDFAPRALVTGRPLIPQDPSSLLAEAAKVGFLRPGELSRAELRRALGLEMIDEAIPDGVYLIQSDAGPRGIFVQGDLDRLLLAIADGWQYAEFQAGESDWRLKFSPAAGRMEFSGPNGLTAADRVPLGMILVNGRIASLSAAQTDPEGRLTPAPDQDISCILAGVTLTIVSAAEVSIGSQLLHEGVKWMKGVPYVKDNPSQLVLYAAGRDLIDGSARDGRIIIGAEAPAETRIQASLTAADGFAVDGDSKTVVVSGGLQTSALLLGGNRLKIAPDERVTTGGLAPALGPAAAEPVLLILSVRPLSWTERRP
ncbi:MAG: hypothetical protein ABSA30_00800 [Candidatus Aminicenantales bacterium]|jgi:hypothetical protein